jgi:hypothetical protein
MLRALLALSLLTSIGCVESDNDLDDNGQGNGNGDMIAAYGVSDMASGVLRGDLGPGGGGGPADMGVSCHGHSPGDMARGGFVSDMARGGFVSDMARGGLVSDMARGGLVGDMASAGVVGDMASGI